MFDKLVESTNEKRRGRAGRIFFLTTLVYGMLLGTVAIATILGLNPTLAESLRVIDIAPPVPLGDPIPQPTKAQLADVPTTAPPTVVPKNPPPVATPDIINRFKDVARDFHQNSDACHGCPPGGASPNGVVGGFNTNDTPPEPLPPPRPRPTPDPTPEPTPMPMPMPKIVKVSQISQGMALRRVSPQYPPIARTIRLEGSVQVQVLISEEGRVISTEIVSGHPTLRAAAEEAARQWVFRPTILNEVPVKVQGILTFNFTLN